MRTIDSFVTKRGIGRLTFAAAASTLLLTGVLVTPAAASGPPYATTTSIVTSPSAPLTGQKVTFTATVTSPTAPPLAKKPTGQIVFTIKGKDLSVVNCDGSDTVTPLTNSAATCTVSGGLLATATPYSVTAAYTDTLVHHYGSSLGTASIAVAKGSTTTTVTSSANPSVSAQPLVLTASVAVVGPSVGSPTGWVNFTGVGPCNNLPLVGGTATCNLPAGLAHVGQPYNVTATYTGDRNFKTSSGTLKQIVYLAKATISMALSPNTCNGGVSCAEVPGVPLAFTATAASVSPSVGVPAGPVVFSILAAGTTTSLTCQGGNSVPLTAGVGVCHLPNGVPASVYYTVTATLGDPNYQPVTATTYLNSDLVSTTTTLAVPTNVTAGETFKVVATVVGRGTQSPTPPTGWVAITVCQYNVVRACQGVPIQLQPDGTATLIVRGGEFPGKYEAYARYLGDQNYWASTAPNLSSNVFTVTTTPTVVVASSDNNPSIDSNSVNITAVLQAANNAATSTLVGPPTGTITFQITDANNVSYSCLDGNVFTIRTGHVQGAYTCFLPPGTLTDPNAPGSTLYTVQVSYSGDSNYDPSTMTYVQTVAPPLG